MNSTRNSFVNDLRKYNIDYMLLKSNIVNQLWTSFSNVVNWK